MATTEELIEEFFAGHYMDDEMAAFEDEGSYFSHISTATCRACGALVKRNDVELHAKFHDELRSTVNKIINTLTSWTEAWERQRREWHRKPRKENR